MWLQLSNCSTRWALQPPISRFITYNSTAYRGEITPVQLPYMGDVHSLHIAGLNSVFSLIVYKWNLDSDPAYCYEGLLATNQIHPQQIPRTGTTPSSTLHKFNMEPQKIMVSKGIFVFFSFPIFSPWTMLNFWRVHPRKLTWNLKMMVFNRKLLFQGFIFRFHVSFRECSENFPSTPRFMAGSHFQHSHPAQVEENITRWGLS